MNLAVNSVRNELQASGNQNDVNSKIEETSKKIEKFTAQIRKNAMEGVELAAQVLIIATPALATTGVMIALGAPGNLLAFTVIGSITVVALSVIGLTTYASYKTEYNKYVQPLVDQRKELMEKAEKLEKEANDKYIQEMDEERRFQEGLKVIIDNIDTLERLKGIPEKQGPSSFQPN